MEDPKGAGIEELKNQCMDSEGYLIFGAHLTNRKDDNHRPIIDFNYRRYHFTLEDAKQAIGQLKKFVDEEMERLIKGDDL